ncbi:MAG: type II toxin-antitoxin system VapC family toxin [Actinobacteria bacterium]|nr:type II toxin-antitoxin system VapC family toxin [Actinomycetota bacterium]
MIVLDTNVISELARQGPSERVLAWVDSQDRVAVTATTAAELLCGIARLPDGARKSRLEEAIREMMDGPLRDGVLAFDRAAASHYAEIVADRDKAGRPIAIADAQITAICRSRGAPLGTRNVRDFDAVGIKVVNPWEQPE